MTATNDLPRRKYWMMGNRDVLARSPWLRHDLCEISRVKTMIDYSRSLDGLVLSTGGLLSTCWPGLGRVADRGGKQRG